MSPYSYRTFLLPTSSSHPHPSANKPDKPGTSQTETDDKYILTLSTSPYVFFQLVLYSIHHLINLPVPETARAPRASRTCRTVSVGVSPPRPPTTPPKGPKHRRHTTPHLQSIDLATVNAPGSPRSDTQRTPFWRTLKTACKPPPPPRPPITLHAYP